MDSRDKIIIPKQTNMTNLEIVQEYIETYQLQQKSRYSHLLYMRSYLYNVLYIDGMSLTQIGKVFNRTHATVYNGINKHRQYMSYNDKVYLEYTAHLENKFTYKQELKPLKDMVLALSSMEEVEHLQTMISNHYL